MLCQHFVLLRQDVAHLCTPEHGCDVCRCFLLLDRLCAPRGPVFPCQRLTADIDVVIGACPARRGNLECTSAPHSLALTLDSCAFSEALLSALLAKMRVGTTAMTVTHFSLDPVFLGWSPAGNAWTFTAKRKKLNSRMLPMSTLGLKMMMRILLILSALPWSGCESGKTPVLFRISLSLLISVHSALSGSYAWCHSLLLSDCCQWNSYDVCLVRVKDQIKDAVDYGTDQIIVFQSLGTRAKPLGVCSWRAGLNVGPVCVILFVCLW